MERNRAGRRLGLSEILTKDRLHSFSGLAEVVVRDLREEMMHYVGSNVVMNFIENTEITVDGGESSTHVGPFRPTIPWYLLFRVRGAVMMEVRHGIEPHDKHPVRKDIELKHSHRAKSESAGGKDTNPCHLEGV
jgi:hypothetical protein